MIVGVSVESYLHERRVALVPAVVPVLTKIGMKVLVQHGAGEKAGFPDTAYEEQGASIAVDRARLFSEADIIVRMHGLVANSPTRNPDLELLRSGQVVLGLLDPLANPESIRELAETGVTAFALELLPRVSRAQSMDALSSMATVAG
jgi:NAD(P) transhydrogenase subunit alpha